METLNDIMDTATSHPPLLITHAEAVVTMDEAMTVIPDGYVTLERNTITGLGRASNEVRRRFLDQHPQGMVLSAHNKVVLPGLINTHHHFYQTLTRAYPPVMNSALFHWLTNLYPIWANLDEEAIRLSTQVALLELLLSGCTTSTDHHYVFPQGISGKLIDIQIQAAQELGIRFHPCRGSMNLSEKDGGLPPDSVVQTASDILKDSERLIDAYHDPSPGAMVRIALAPCSPFSVTMELMEATAELACDKGVRLHTHLAETIDEENFCRQRFGHRPLEYLEKVGWMRDNVWLAHGIHFSSEEIRQLGQAGVGVAHCPHSNMRLGSGVCKVTELMDAGSPVGIAVDGSASNDASNMLAEVRQAMLLARLARGADTMTVLNTLKMATVGSAGCLGRQDLGRLEVGACADLALFALNDLGYSGAGDPVGALLLCHPTRVNTLIVHGKIIVQDGQVLTADVPTILEKHRRKATHIQGV